MTHYKTILGYAIRGQEYRDWYRHARVVMERIAVDVGKPVRYVCDVVAIFSPRLQVSRNIQVSYAYLTTERVPAYVLRPTRAALQHYRDTGVIRGPKTSRYAKCLAGDDDVVVVDTHIATAFGYRPQDARYVSTQRVVEKIIGRIAATCGWSLADTQAAVWGGYYQTAYPTGSVPVVRFGEETPY